ncbi:U3 small nucleolar ribonucleoprotein protein MPP10-like [Schistocerca gregaria]|uniref:U3 small nucleolar ribonucleoprotein protein MPP10-like n=1 Tax=Schistocerca gregaria TaxID=7010 RepID=UPI00211E8F5F|nr:U3 small nucleolar ribonucleoprotein protein MPP10-like [Schistocerca gregaria]
MATSAEKKGLQPIFEQVSNIATSPEVFAAPSREIREKVLQLTKLFFDHAASEQRQLFECKNTIDELIVDGFDIEQIWQEVYINNLSIFPYIEKQVDGLLTDSRDCSIFEHSSNSDIETTLEANEEAKEVEENCSESESCEFSGNFSEEEDDVPSTGHAPGSLAQSDKANSRVHKKKSELDDEFFCWEECVRFADEGEDGKRGLLFGEEGSDDEELYNMMYGDGLADEVYEGEHDSESSGKLVRKGGQEKLESIDDDQVSNKMATGKSVARRGEGKDIEKNPSEIYYEDFFGSLNSSREDDAEGEGELDYGDSEESELDEVDLEEVEGDQLDDQDLTHSAQMSEFQLKNKALREQVKFLEQESLLNNDAMESDDPENHSDEDLGLSAFAQRQKAIQNKIRHLEKEALRKKDWQLSGETDAKSRPENSLLEHVLEFEHATKLVPTITQDVTQTIEEMIKHRITDGAFDDVIRVLEVPDKGDWRPRAPILDQEKSLKSLEQIYEDEYVKQTAAVSDVQEITREHQECATLFKKICFKLDALSNAHYSPVKFLEELEVKPLTDAPAIQMEEATPDAVSTATILAPEAIYASEHNGAVRSENELTRDDRKKARRLKKKRDTFQRKLQEHEAKRQAKLHPDKLSKPSSVSNALAQIEKLGNKEVNISQRTDDVRYQSSTAVFKKIQDSTSRSNSASVLPTSLNRQKKIGSVEAKVFLKTSFL